MTDPRNPDVVVRTRNVIDIYKNLDDEAIRAALEPGKADAVAICMNLTHDFNKGSVLRALNAHNLKEMWLVGSRQWNRRGAVGTQNYTNVKYTREWESLFADLRADGYTIVAIDNADTATSMYETVFPTKTAFVFGEEQAGLEQEVIDACDALVYIEQFGSVRSMNVAQAAAICFYEYRRTHKK